MLKCILIIGIVIFTGLNVVAAQQQPIVASCNPYGIGTRSVNIQVADLNATSQATTAAIQQRLGVNPDVYLLLAANITETNNTKAEFADPNSKLMQAAYANVTDAGDHLQVYAGICASTEVLGELRAGERVTVLDGPLASEGHAWWRIRSHDLTGWVIEGDGDELWLHGS